MSIIGKLYGNSITIDFRSCVKSTENSQEDAAVKGKTKTFW